MDPVPGAWIYQIECFSGEGSRIRIKDQSQGSGSRIRIKDQDQGSESRIGIKDQDDDDDGGGQEEGSHLPAAEPEEKSAYHQL